MEITQEELDDLLTNEYDQGFSDGESEGWDSGYEEGYENGLGEAE